MKWSIIFATVCGVGVGLALGALLGAGHGSVGDDADDHADHPAAGAGGEEAEVKPVCRVRLAPLAHGDLAMPIIAFGAVAFAPSGVVQVGAPYECTVATLSVTEGTAVVVGAALVDLIPSPEAVAQRDEAQMTFAAAERDLAQTQKRLDLRLATAQELSQAQAAVDLARLKAHTWEQRLAEGGRRVIAVVAGRVSRVLVRVGQQVPIGTPLVELISGDHTEVHLGLDPSDVARLVPDQAVQVTAVRRSGPTAPLALRMTTLATQVTPETGLLDAVVPLPAGAGLTPGEPVRGEIARMLSDVLIAPREALIREEDGWVVFTAVEHHAVRHVVELLGETRTHAAIAGKDLQADAALIIEGNAEVHDGMELKILGKDAP